MKILIYSSYYLPYLSGMTVYAETLAKSLARGNDVIVLAFRHENPLPAAERSGRIIVKRLPFWFRLSKGFISPQSLFRFFTEAKRHDAVIINIPNAEALPLAVYARLMGKRLISIYHCRVNLGPGLWNRVVIAFLEWSVRIQLSLSHAVIANPESNLSFPYLDTLGNRVRQVMPPVKKPETDKAALASFGKEKANAVWIGFAGRIAREKGLETLIGAMEILRKSHPVELVLAGPSASAGELDYQRKIFRLLAEKNIRYRSYGQLEKTRLGSFMKSLDVLVLPSTDSTEAFGLVQAEAMLLGTPVAASNLPGVRIPVNRTGMGKTFEPNDYVQLANAIRKILAAREQFISPDSIRKAKSLFEGDDLEETIRSGLI